jgi:hypothetical protein
MNVDDVVRPDTEQGMESPLSAGSTSALSLLSALSMPPEVRGLYYNRQIVQIDGYRFISCRFDSCRLLVASTNFEFNHCVIDPGCVIEYHGDTVRLIKLFSSRYWWADQHFPGFVPTRHADGTLSITTYPVPE